MLRIVLSPSLTYTPGSAWATGRAVGQTDLNSWSTFRDPDSISPDGRTLTWNLGNVTPSLVDPAIRVMVDAFDSSPPGSQSVSTTVSYLDAMGNSSRGTSSGYTNNYSSSGGNNCYLDPPRIRLYKYPDSSPILPGQSASYSVNVALINGGLPAIVKAGTVLTDVLPAGLTYTGATFSPAIAYSELVTPLPGGATKIEWTLTADVTASFSIVVPITIPAGAASGTLYENSAAIDAIVPHNTCGDYSCSGGPGNVISDDVGSFLVKNAGSPTIEKSAASNVVDFDSSTVLDRKSVV